MDRLAKIMMAVEGSRVSLDAVEYVSRMLGGRKDLHIRLFHVLPPIPPGLLEFGGSEDPCTEASQSAKLKKAQHRWLEEAEQSARQSLETAVTLLVDHGFFGHQVTTELSSSIHEPDIVQAILEAAKQWDCGTIVVGRHTLPWFRELFSRHVGEELVRKAQGYAVWVVE